MIDRNASGQFITGHSGLKKKGSIHKTTKQARELITELFAGEMDAIEVTLQKVTPAEKLDFLIKLLPYVCPKAEALPDDDDLNAPIGIPMIHFIASSTPDELANNRLT